MQEKSQQKSNKLARNINWDPYQFMGSPQSTIVSFIPESAQKQQNPFPNNLSKRIFASPQYLPASEVMRTYSSQFIKEFEGVSGRENLFPILLETVGQNVYVCSKDCFISFQIQEPAQYEKVKLPEMPTCFKAHGELLYFGLKSGLIIVFNIITKTTLTTIDEFCFPIVQLHTLNKDSFLAMDIMGNIKAMSLTLKILMDRIVKVGVTTTDIIEQYRIKKRDKLKNFVKSFTFGKQKQKQEESQVKSGNSVLQPEAQKTKNLAKQGIIDYMPRFCVLPPELRSQDQSYPLIYFHKKKLYCVILSQNNTKISESVILEETDGQIGILELGEGGFTHSNQVHIVLVVSFGSHIHYYRQIQVETNLQYLKISEKTHKSKIYTGKFISNNLLIYLTEDGVQISNVNGQMSTVSKLAMQKFSYLDFFNEEEGFNFDKRLLYNNILKTDRLQDGDCGWCCLQGKRIISGRIFNWKNYLAQMADEFLWEKCMISSLMIYKDAITLLAGIPQRVQERNQTMQHTFEKITLTYLSYSLKNSENPLEYSEFISRAIDFMVRTQSFTYLCTTIYQATKSYGLQHAFIEGLEQFVESGTLKWVTDEILVKIVQHYTNKLYNPIQMNKNIDFQIEQKLISKNQTVSTMPSPTKSQQELDLQLNAERSKLYLETMIMGFDMSKMEKSLLLSICLNHQLYRSLIYICKEQGDFVTPVIKLCGLRVARADQLSKLLKSQSQSSHHLDFLLSKMSKLTKILFFYLRQCLRGHYTEHNNIKAYLDMLQQIVEFIFMPSSLLMLLQASPKSTFLILNTIFGAQVMQHLLENEGAITLKKSKFSNADSTTDSQLELSEELSLCWCHYYPHQSLQSVQHTKICAPVLLVSNCQQFSIYSSILAVVLYTIAENYLKLHSNQTIVPKLRLEYGSNQIQMEQKDWDRLSEKEQSQVFLYWSHRFVSYLILSNSFPFRLAWKHLAFEFMVTYPRIFAQFPLPIQNKIGDKADQTQQRKAISQILMRIIDSIVRSMQREYENSITDQNSRVKAQSRTCDVLRVLQKILGQQSRTQQYKLLIATHCYLLDMLNQPEEIISTLLSSQVVQIKNQVYQYLQHSLTEVLKGYEPIPSTQFSNQKMQPIGTLSLQHPLITAMLNRAPQMLHAYNEPIQNQITELLITMCTRLIHMNEVSLTKIIGIADKIKEFPKQQLAFLEAAIKSYEGLLHMQAGHYSYDSLGQIGKNMEKLALKHLAVVVEHAKDKLEQYILKVNYPLEEAYRVCEQSNNKTAMAYILIKSGRNVEGVLLICELFVTGCRELFRDLAKNAESQVSEQHMAKLDDQLTKILETCTNEYANDVARGEQLWEKISEKLFKQLNLKVIDTIPILKIRQILQKFIDKIITAMFIQVNPEFFIEKFSQNSKMTVPTRIYLQAHDLVFQRLEFKWNINSITKEMQRQGEMKLYKNIIKINSQGFSVSTEIQANCALCGNQLYRSVNIQEQSENAVINSQDPNVAFLSCGHYFHVFCYEQHKSEMIAKKLSSPSKKKAISYFECPICRSDFVVAIYGQSSGSDEPLKYVLPKRARSKSILIERKNKLADFDSQITLNNSAIRE